jgi:hypothetical protein
MRGKFILIVFSLIFLANLACAQFVFSEEGSSIIAQYSPSEHIKAEINMSFQEEPLNSSFTDSLGNSINLSDLIDLIPEFDYSLDSTSQKINSEFYVIQFNVAKFSLPTTTGTINYQLSFNGVQIFEEEISIASLNNSIQSKINEKKELLNELKLEIKKFDYSTEQMLYKELNIYNTEIRLNEIESKYQGEISSQEYEEIIKNISEIKIPKGVQEIKNSTPINFYPKEEFINLDFLASIGGNGNYTSENSEEYKNALNAWYADNLKTKVIFKEILISYDQENRSILKIFNFEFDKRELKNDAYFIIEDLQDIVFDGDYSENKLDGYIYIDLKGVSEIIFSTKKNIDFITLPVFIAPSLEDIEILGPIQEWKPIYWFILFGLIIFLILLIAIIIYAGIQLWYRRRYENALFKNRNNLYNIMTYIQHSKKKGMSRENIMKNLKKAKWRREQINYALNKYEGKKIAGIIERPFKKILEEIDKNPDKYPKK